MVTNGKRQTFSYSHDIHSHMLPALDDGSRSLEMSVGLVRRMTALGFKKLSFTPHINYPAMPNDRDSISEAYRRLRSELDRAGIGVETCFGAEYRLCREVLDTARGGDVLPFSGNYVLLEHSFSEESPLFGQTLRELRGRGFAPVLAHPERYEFWDGDVEERCREVHEEGCLLQVNLLSLAGFYGPGPERKGWKLLDAGVIDMIGSDAHNYRYLDAIEDFLHSRTAARLNGYKFLNKNGL